MSKTSGEHMQLKIGELARRSGVTIRALRHYDAIGLLSPSARSAGGFRLYGHDDVARLYRIQALARLDLPLGEIGRILGAGGPALDEVVDQQIAALNQQIAQAVALRDHLTTLQSRRQPGAGMDAWLAALARMSSLPRYFNDADRAALHATPGPHKQALTTELQALMAHGTGADSAAAQDLGWRWMQLLMTEVGGDEGRLMKYYAMQWHEPALQALSGIDRAGMRFIAHAMAHRRLAIYARYCSAAEMALLRRHYVRQTEAWPPLIAAIRVHMAEGTAHDDPALQDLVREWQTLEHKKTGGQPALAAKLRLAFAQDPAVRFGSGIDDAFLAYLHAALQALDHSGVAA